MGERKKAFKCDEFLKNAKVEQLQDEHKKAFGGPINDLGYPDMGNGRYTDLIPYEKWVSFNNAQRGHYNMVESSGPVMAAMVVGGIFQPVICAALGAGYAVGRLVYMSGYQSKKGADARIAGAIIGSVCTISLFGLNIWFGVKSFL